MRLQSKQAFPMPAGTNGLGREELEINGAQPGMTYREWLAGKFFAAMLSNADTGQRIGNLPQEAIERRLAELSCQMADALITRLDPPLNLQQKDVEP